MFNGFLTVTLSLISHIFHPHVYIYLNLEENKGVTNNTYTYDLHNLKVHKDLNESTNISLNLILKACYSLLISIFYIHILETCGSFIQIFVTAFDY